jgi:hypothetical protein
MHRGVRRERLVFAPRVSPAEYLARFQLADLVLDTFPYNAGTTASDALWMGTPILTRSGRTYISRMAGSLLTAVGLPDLITETLADYERLAVAIGRQPARASSYKRYLAEQGRQSPLFDLPARVRDIEEASSPAWRWPPALLRATGDEPGRRRPCDRRDGRRAATGAAGAQPARGPAGPGAGLADAPPRARALGRRAVRRAAGQRALDARRWRCACCAKPACTPRWSSDRWPRCMTCCCPRCCC